MARGSSGAMTREGRERWHVDKWGYPPTVRAGAIARGQAGGRFPTTFARQSFTVYKRRFQFRSHERADVVLGACSYSLLAQT
jgi:hypothetical protein